MPSAEFFSKDMQMVRAKAAKVILAAIETDGDPTAIMATIVDRSPLFPAVMDATDNIASWAGILAVIAGELADLLAGEEFVSAKSLLYEVLHLSEESNA